MWINALLGSELNLRYRDRSCCHCRCSCRAYSVLLEPAGRQSNREHIWGKQIKMSGKIKNQHGSENDNSICGALTCHTFPLCNLPCIYTGSRHRALCNRSQNCPEIEREIMTLLFEKKYIDAFNRNTAVWVWLFHLPVRLHAQRARANSARPLSRVPIIAFFAAFTSIPGCVVPAVLKMR